MQTSQLSIERSLIDDIERHSLRELPRTGTGNAANDDASRLVVLTDVTLPDLGAGPPVSVAVRRSTAPVATSWIPPRDGLAQDRREAGLRVATSDGPQRPVLISRVSSSSCARAQGSLPVTPAGKCASRCPLLKGRGSEQSVADSARIRTSSGRPRDPSGANIDEPVSPKPTRAAIDKAPRPRAPVAPIIWGLSHHTSR